jgi:glyoxylase-like metal-dependent hydrolase (beta-lactamase superfamily II)
VPGAGELIEVAPGIGWARLPVPGSLGHINIWALEDGEGVALVDTGLDIPPAREAWEALFAGPLAGRAVTRIIVTHMHPDHVGLAGWLCERFGVRLWMTRGEWLFARALSLDAGPRRRPRRKPISVPPAGARNACRRRRQAVEFLRQRRQSGAARYRADAGRRRPAHRRAHLPGGRR